MSNFLFFCSTFLFFVANLIGGHWDHLPIMYSSVTPCHFAWQSQRNGIQMKIKSKFIRPLHASQIWKHIHWTFRYMNRLNTYWTPPEHLWVHVNANEWVLNTPWTPIECAWMPMSECEHPLNTHWVHMTAIEWVWTPIECTWLPLSHYWTWLTMVWP